MALTGPYRLNKRLWEMHALQTSACLELRFFGGNPSKLLPFLPSGQTRVFAWFEVPADIYCCVNAESGTRHRDHWHRKSPLPPGGSTLALRLLGSALHQPIGILRGHWPPHITRKTCQIIELLLGLQNPMEFPQERRGRACRRAVGADGGCRCSKMQPDGAVCSPFSSPSPKQALLYGQLGVAQGSRSLFMPWGAVRCCEMWGQAGATGAAGPG